MTSLIEFLLWLMDVVIWACDEGPVFTPRRPQDRAVVTNIVEAMRLYAAGELGDQPIPFHSHVSASQAVDVTPPKSTVLLRTLSKAIA